MRKFKIKVFYALLDLLGAISRIIGPQQKPAILFISSGRCGSTLLAKIHNMMLFLSLLTNTGIFVQNIV